MPAPTVPAPDRARSRRLALVGTFFGGVWLVFLWGTVRDAWLIRGTLAGQVALVALALFVAAYLWLFAHIRTLGWAGAPTPAAGWVLLVGMVVLSLVVMVTLGQDGTATLAFVVAAAMQVLPQRAGLVCVGVVALGHELAGRLVPGWTEDASLTFAIAATGLAMWGVQQMIARNRELLLAREENARLAVAEERNRFARDLHDILGHSLTVITVKAELAGRLLDVSPEQARTEVAEIERLSRDALTEVRQAVAGYRQPSLSGELVRARQALAAAGIVADLPTSTDAVPTELRDLFAWTIREGVTNVIRHSGARHCTLRLSADEVELVDDGRGPDPAGTGSDEPGHGLVGLRERAAEAGAAVETEVLDPGFALRVVARG